MTRATPHLSVMLDETLVAIAPHAGGTYADATLGAAGHAAAILQASAPDGRLIGVDRDPAALAIAAERLAVFGERAVLVHGLMGEMQRHLAHVGVERIDGLIADVGLSSMQLDDASRGFAFSQEAALDMRMDPTAGESAKELIERLDESALADVIYELGEERRSRPIARSICRARDAGELETTTDLRRAVHRAVGRLGGKRSRIDPATRTFQALRIAVNGELEQLRLLIGSLPRILADGAVAVIISFHSLEDRIVKRAFRDAVDLRPVTKKPTVPSDAEVAQNPRARSAKLRAARRCPRDLVDVATEPVAPGEGT